MNLATNDAVWDWDLRTGQLWWNDAVEALFGYPKQEVTTGLAWWTDRVHPDDRSRVEHTFHDAAQNGDHRSEDYRFLRKDGAAPRCKTGATSCETSAGTPIRMIGSMQDITERKRQEKRIRDLAFREPRHGPSPTVFPCNCASQTGVFKNAQSSGDKVALLLTNLNYFRDINDSPRSPKRRCSAQSPRQTTRQHHGRCW